MRKKKRDTSRVFAVGFTILQLAKLISGHQSEPMT